VVAEQLFIEFPKSRLCKSDTLCEGETGSGRREDSRVAECGVDSFGLGFIIQ
jgi:hypothetical protein